MKCDGNQLPDPENYYYCVSCDSKIDGCNKCDLNDDYSKIICKECK